MIFSIIRSNKFLIFFLIAVIGFSIRLVIAQWGFNFDFEMWKGNLLLFQKNKSIYEFGNYTYSPLWINILNILDRFPYPLDNSYISQIIPGSSFRIKIIFFLSVVDFLIFLLIYQNYSLKTGLLFFFNPISVIITGHHNQFNNLPILLGFYAILLYQNFRSHKKIIFPLIIFGFSLCAKHILIFFPIWWAIKEREIKNKILILTIPYLIFFLSFYPYIFTEFYHVYEKLIHFGKRNDGPFWGMFGPKILHMYGGNFHGIFTILLIVIGFLFEKIKLKDTFYLYLLAVVIFSPGMYTQYLVIAALPIAIFWNFKYLLFSFLTFCLFLVDGDELNIGIISELLNWNLRSTRIAFYPIILVLLIGFLENSFGEKKFKNYLKKTIFYILSRIKSQFLFKK